jgi:hypothetical protein
MKAIEFDILLPRFVLGKGLSSVYKPFFWSGLSCLRYGEIPESASPSPVEPASHPGSSSRRQRTILAHIGGKGINQALKAVFAFE